MDASDLKKLRDQLGDVYRDYRNVVMSRKHYEDRLKTLQRWNTVYEIVIAVGTSGTVGSWAIWSEGVGKSTWIVIGAIVALLTVIKPFLKLAERIEQKSTLATKYAAMQIDFQLLIFDIKSEGKLSSACRKIYKEICKKMQDLGSKDDATPAAKRLRRFCEEVNREIPPESLWSP